MLVNANDTKMLKMLKVIFYLFPMPTCTRSCSDFIWWLQLYKAALGNCFEIDDWGPIEFSIMAKHFDRQGKPPYAYHAVRIYPLVFHLVVCYTCLPSTNLVARYTILTGAEPELVQNSKTGFILNLTFL